MTKLAFDPLIAPASWLLLAGMSGLAFIWYASRPSGSLSFRRWAAVLSLMAISLILVLVTLLNPNWIVIEPPPEGKPALTVLVDSSASMATRDAEGKRERYEAAAEEAARISRELASRFDIELMSFAGSAIPTEEEAMSSTPSDGSQTDLAGAIRESIGEARPRGRALVLLSDGIHNAGGGSGEVMDAVRSARASAVPIFTKTFGGEEESIDLSVDLGVSRQMAFIQQDVTLTCIVRHRGLSGRSTEIILRSDGQEIQRKALVLSSSESAEVSFTVSRQRPGLYRYEVEAVPVAQELTRLNNVASFVLQVVDEPIRVLLLEGKPYWDAKFLIRTLAQDPAIELHSVVQVAPQRFIKRVLTSAPPGEPRETGGGAAEERVRPDPAIQEETGRGTLVREEDWEILNDPSPLLASSEILTRYQVIVLGRDADVFLDEHELDAIREWVSRRGGCLVCYRGSPTAQVGEKLASLLPVRWMPSSETRFRVQLTERGQALHWVTGEGIGLNREPLSQLPSLGTSATSVRTNPMAVVLARGSSAGDLSLQPVITYQPFGLGRTVVIEGAGMWRWAFLPPQHKEQDHFYASLWRGLLRWLVTNSGLLPGQTIALRSEKVTFMTTEPANVSLLMSGPGNTSEARVVELVGPDDVQTFRPAPIGREPGSFRVVFGKLPAGRYEALVRGDDDDVAARTIFDVRDSFRERVDLVARPDLMARVAQDSGGAVLTSASPAEIVARFEEYSDRIHPPRVTRTTAWDRWWFLVGVFGVWTATWGLRRFEGLV